MDKKFVTNIAFIILILFLLIGACKAQKSPVTFEDIIGLGNQPSAPEVDYSTVVNVKKDKTPRVILSDFDEVEEVAPVDKTIDRATAMSYVSSRKLSGSEMLALIKVKKISSYLNSRKQVVIHVTKGSNAETRAFIKEFTKTLNKHKNDARFVFFPVETVWQLDENDIKNTQDRIIYNLQKDCGNFCIMDLRAEKLTTLKGYNVNKKSAEIVDVILNSL